MSPAQELAAAATTLSDAADDVSLFTESWSGLFHEKLSGLPREIARYCLAVNPAVVREVADSLREWEGFEFREDGPMPDDLAAALRIARAVNGGDE